MDKASENLKKKKKPTKLPKVRRDGEKRTTKRGRPSNILKATPIIVKHLKQGCSQRDASILAGISAKTYHDWYSIGLVNKEDEIETEYSLFCDLVDKAKAECRQGLVTNWLNHTNKDWRAAMAYLERTDPEHYALKQKIETTQKVEVDQKKILEIPDNGRRKIKDKNDGA